MICYCSFSCWCCCLYQCKGLDAREFQQEYHQKHFQHPYSTRQSAASFSSFSNSQARPPSFALHFTRVIHCGLLHRHGHEIASFGFLPTLPSLIFEMMVVLLDGWRKIPVACQLIASVNHVNGPLPQNANVSHTTCFPIGLALPRYILYISKYSIDKHDKQEWISYPRTLKIYLMLPFRY